MATYLQRLNPAATMPSLNIWEQFPAEDVLGGGRRGVYEHYDFCTAVAGTADTNFWDTTVVEAGGGGDSTAVQTSGHGGLLLITTDNAALDGVQMQHGGAAWLTLADCDMVALEARIKLDDSGLATCFFGLSDTDTAIIGAASALTSGDHVGLFSAAADDTVAGVVEAGGTARTVAALTSAELADDTYANLGLTVDATGKVQFYFNGDLVGNYDGSGNPTAVLRPSLAVETSTTAVRTATVDWIRIGALFSD